MLKGKYPDDLLEGAAFFVGGRASVSIESIEKIKGFRFEGGEFGRRGDGFGREFVIEATLSQFSDGDAELKGLAWVIATSLVEVCKLVRGTFARWEGKEVLGDVAGRPLDEDRDLAIDEQCRSVYLEQFGAVQVPGSFEFYFENPEADGVVSYSSGPKYMVSVDELDGTGEYERGEDWYLFSVVTINDAAGVPIIGGMIDIPRGIIWIASRRGVFRFSLDGDDGGELDYVSRSRRVRVTDDARFASYLVDTKYAGEFIGATERLRKDFRLKIFPNGGSGIYSSIADGKYEGYVMCGEPLSEFFPALAFMYFSGPSVFFVDDSGVARLLEKEELRFDPKKRTERVPFFLVTCTPELGKDFLGYVEVGGKKVDMSQLPP